jgi:hypothetical protein
METIIVLITTIIMVILAYFYCRTSIITTLINKYDTPDEMNQLINPYSYRIRRYIPDIILCVFILFILSIFIFIV